MQYNYTYVLLNWPGKFLVYIVTILTLLYVLDSQPHCGLPPSLSFATSNKQLKTVAIGNTLLTLVRKEASACKLETCTQIFVTSSAEIGPPLLICTLQNFFKHLNKHKLLVVIILRSYWDLNAVSATYIREFRGFFIAKYFADISNLLHQCLN